MVLFGTRNVPVNAWIYEHASGLSETLLPQAEGSMHRFHLGGTSIIKTPSDKL